MPGVQSVGVGSFASAKTVISFVDGLNRITRIPPGGSGVMPVFGAMFPKNAMKTSPLFPRGGQRYAQMTKQHGSFLPVKVF